MKSRSRLYAIIIITLLLVGVFSWSHIWGFYMKAEFAVLRMMDRDKNPEKGYWAYLEKEAKTLGVRRWHNDCTSVFVIRNAKNKLSEEICNNSRIMDIRFCPGSLDQFCGEQDECRVQLAYYRNNPDFCPRGYFCDVKDKYKECTRRWPEEFKNGWK